MGDVDVLACLTGQGHVYGSIRRGPTVATEACSLKEKARPW